MENKHAPANTAVDPRYTRAKNDETAKARRVGTVTHLIMMGIVTTLTVSTRQAIISTTLDTDSPPATFMNKDRKSIASSTACDG